jgi:hypothetical protein
MNNHYLLAKNPGVSLQKVQMTPLSYCVSKVIFARKMNLGITCKKNETWASQFKSMNFIVQCNGKSWFVQNHCSRLSSLSIW